MFKSTYFFRILFFLLFFSALSKPNIYGQCNTVDPIPLVSATFNGLTTSSSSAGVCNPLLGCVISNVSALIDADLTNFATASTTLGAGVTHNLRVTDGNSTYASGTFAGYRIAPSGGLLSLDLLNGISIKTYLGGVLKETHTGSALVSLNLLSNPGNFLVGFNSNQSFDAIEISIGSLLSVSASTAVYYPVIVNYCAGPQLDCNAPTAMNYPLFPTTIENGHTGVSGLSIGSVSNAGNVITASTTDFASINLLLSVLGSGSLAVKDQVVDYPAGTYTGFEIENSNLLSIATLANIEIKTYLNGIVSEQFLANSLAVNAVLLNGSGRYKIGFITTQSFDEVQIIINQTAGVTLGTTRVYNAVFENFCAGPALPCNTPVAVTSPTYPVFVNAINTGIDGLVCAFCSVSDSENLIDADLLNFAQINLTASVGSAGSISIKDQITDYPAGSFAGFDIENTVLLDINVLNAVVLTTYLNGVLQESKTGNSALVSVGTNLLVGGSRKTIGFVTALPFDEVKITLINTALVSLGTTKIYSAVFENFCPPTVACDTTYVWTNPDFPVIIDGDNTGIDGVACVACAVNNTNNVLTPDSTDFAEIRVTAGVISSAAIAVADQLFTYPVGTFAGFTIKDLNNLIELDLFQSLTLSTYLDGQLQEAKGGSQLLKLLITIPPVGSGTGFYNVGFQATLPFDAIKISVGSLASAINNINVYGAFVNTTNSDGGTLLCSVSSISITKKGTYLDNNGDGITNIGDTITYAFVVTNTGDTDLSAITVTDPNAVITGGPLATLAAGASDSTTFTGIHTISQSDIDAAVVYNLATVVGTPPTGANVTGTSTDPTPCTTCPVDPRCLTCTVTPLTPSPSIALVKTGTVSGTGSIGDVITYTFAVTNTGNTTITNIVITDPMVGLTISNNPIATLAPGASNSTVKGTYTITQSDVDAGQVTNSALATGQDPKGNAVRDVSGTTMTNDTPTVTPVASSPSIALVKTGTVSGTGSIGDVITYTFAVTNTGNTTITNIVITDPMVGLTISNNPIATLAPGASNSTVKGTYTITQSDVDAGQVTNSALATGQDPRGNAVRDVSGTTMTNDTPTVTPVASSPSIALVKTGIVSGTGRVGDVITYTFAVTNTGNTTLTNIVITDPMVGLTISNNPIATLAPGASNSTVKGTYTITQSDVDAGQVTNSALATGQDPRGNAVRDVSGTTMTNDTPTVILLKENPSITLTQRGVFEDRNGDGFAQVGETIRYSYTVMNMGNVTLNSVTLSDIMLGITIVGGPIRLSVGETNSTAFVGIYTLTQQDLIRGFVTDQTIAYGTSPLGTIVQDLSHESNPFEDDAIVLGVKGCILIVFNAVSPNGDGLNDFFLIKGIDCFPNNTVEIYNRWGIKVYDIQGYDNDSKSFKGFSEGRVSIKESNGLPSGTYFYIIKYVDLNGIGIDKTGYLQLSRN
ncbi:gliding motility-associated C-terminal domain-containing protein [Flavobacterium sp. RSP15]|uniref:gliding motility-associated C-terminal domain-containing protein n=1 Tax=Flavobacterium sp. RSP15 TaxID=2497485 RepID=UPI000F842029|nr:gliding motility-associated C-terminal domain-containing protein [Flavobacterium sp. RSP15]RTY88865.1 gliding motility-associated C-terminal domain-containing protein [Flavobacterium sp. RSP15]